VRSKRGGDGGVLMLPRRRKRDAFLPWIQLLTDCAAAYALLRLVYWFRFSSGWFERLSGGAPDFDAYHAAFPFIVLVLVYFLRFYGLYAAARHLTFGQETAKVFRAVFMATLVLTCTTFFVRGFSYSRTYLAIAGLAMAPGLSLVRFLVGVAVMHVDRRRGSYRNVLVAGCNENARRLARFYEKNPRFSTRVVGFLDDRLERGSLFEGVPVLGKLADLPEFTRFRSDFQVHEVVLAEPGVANETVLRMIFECEKGMVAFRRLADVFGLITAKMSVSYLGGIPILSFTDSPLAEWENRALKRALDVALSAAALILLWPVLLVIAALVRADSPGPILFKQKRVGEDGRQFNIYKFRTMRVDAERETGPVWAKPNDPRRTRLGAVLREWNLDELPQLWNVLRGDMSLVGPRPEREEFVTQFKEDIPRYMARHAIRSGITGWAQVNGLRGNTSIEERTQFDLYYIENWSIFFDLRILFMTVFARRNAY
jgi:exopolysaccharide biosynthesis polyprenyl glycosylphosphotransferase